MQYVIKNEQQLRELMGDPVHELVVVKSSPALKPPLQHYIRQSPFVCLATHSDDGAADLSPRGDAPGFVHIRDEKTLIIPERPGNKRLDSVRNIIEQPHLSLLFMIPGVLDTVRVNGTGIVTADPHVLGLFPVEGKLPQLAIVVTVEEAFGHCSKAFRRAKLWQDDYLPKARVPSLVEMMSGHLQLDKDTVEMLEAGIADDVVNNMY